MSNPLLDPIHGVSLQDYAAISAKIAAGVSEKDICKALGIELAIYQEASALWISRMQQDETWELTTLFGQYFGDADNHSKLSTLKPEAGDTNVENLERLKTDRYFYEELNGARTAAYNYGIDGAQWIQDNYGINLGDFQSVGMQWMEKRNEEDDEMILHYAKYMQEKQEEYAAKFAEEQGGNVADDVEF